MRSAFFDERKMTFLVANSFGAYICYICCVVFDVCIILHGTHLSYIIHSYTFFFSADENNKTLKCSQKLPVHISQQVQSWLMQSVVPHSSDIYGISCYLMIKAMQKHWYQLKPHHIDKQTRQMDRQTCVQHKLTFK